MKNNVNSFLRSQEYSWILKLILTYLVISSLQVASSSGQDANPPMNKTPLIKENSPTVTTATSLNQQHVDENLKNISKQNNNETSKKSLNDTAAASSGQKNGTGNSTKTQLLSSIKPDQIKSQTTAEISDNNNKNNTEIKVPTVNPDLTNDTITSEPVLPDKGSAEDEHHSSMSIFFVLCVLALGILLIHLMLQTNFQYVPESILIVVLGGAIGMIINMMSHQNIANWKKEEAFSPTAFFLVLLPPIIFESGYNLHKGNFFQNIGSILVFAIFGTAISAFVIGAGIYLLGLADVAYKLSFVESFAFGSLISAVDPVATVAIFHALDVDPVLNMLVFGESILNDAIAIVLTTSVLESNNGSTTGEAIMLGINRFCLMFFASAGIGVVSALISAMLLKHVDLRKNPSLEFGIMLVFTYAPYVLAEGMQLSGIMAILFNGIVMSHYTHFNLSTVTQVNYYQIIKLIIY